ETKEKREKNFNIKTIKMGVKGDEFPLQGAGTESLLGYEVLRHRRFSVVNASYAKTSQEVEP
ncbi:MAG: hypothetical protein J6M62_07920, partial [Selenomonadaceae bacterium]|nr:hypothetical protein [Selenomonadaceae bacterium]